MDFWIHYSINHFFRVYCPEKRGFSNYKNLISITCTVVPIVSHGNIFSLHATTFGSLFPHLRDLDSRLGGCRIRGIDYLFFQFI
jgi:hypothetical protein